MEKTLQMKLAALILIILTYGCFQNNEISSINPENWSKRAVDISKNDSLEYGKSYLSVYSQIYSFSQSQKYNLTGMISLRNTSDADTIYLLKAAYFDTHGSLIRAYFDYPIFLSPLETIEIIIDHKDEEGGTGGNFIFEWKTPGGCPEPLFEGVMSSMQGSLGISFTTQARRIE